MIRRHCIAAVALVAVANLAAAADPMPDGVQIEAEAQPPWRPMLARYEHGARDPRFGPDGRVLLSSIVPQSAIDDGHGRTLVVGHLPGPPLTPALQRYLANGALDPSFGLRGTASDAPLRGDGSARFALPLGDGRTLVLGEVQQRQPRAALWVVGADGRFEAAWLLLSTAPRAACQAPASVAGDVAMLGVQVVRGDEITLEAFIYEPARAGAAMPDRVAWQAFPSGWAGTTARLAQRDSGWFWIDPEQPPAPALRLVGSDDAHEALWTWQRAPLPAAAPAKTAPPMQTREPDFALTNPFAERSSQTPGAAAPQPSRGIGWGATLGIALLAGLAGGAWWRRRR